MPHAGSSCAHARSPASTYCRARSSQYARFLATCSSSSLIANPRSFNPNQYNQELAYHVYDVQKSSRKPVLLRVTLTFFAHSRAGKQAFLLRLVSRTALGG